MWPGKGEDLTPPQPLTHRFAVAPLPHQGERVSEGQVRGLSGGTEGRPSAVFITRTRVTKC